MNVTITYTPLTWEECQVKTRLLASGKYSTRIQHPSIKMLSAAITHITNPIKPHQQQMECELRRQLLHRINKKLSALQQLTESRINTITYDNNH